MFLIKKLTSAKRDFEATKESIEKSKQLERAREQSKNVKLINKIDSPKKMYCLDRDCTEVPVPGTAYVQKDAEYQKLKSDLKEVQAKFNLVIEEPNNSKS